MQPRAAINASHSPMINIYRLNCEEKRSLARWTIVEAARQQTNTPRIPSGLTAHGLAMWNKINGEHADSDSDEERSNSGTETYDFEDDSSDTEFCESDWSTDDECEQVPRNRCK
jgi:hypothetical protein